MNYGYKTLSYKKLSIMKITKPVLSIILFFLASSAFAQPVNNAMKLLEMKQYRKAKSAFISNLKTRNLASDWFYLREIYLVQDNADSAKMCLSKIAFADPKSALNLVAQAMNELLAGNKSQALLTLDKAQKAAASNKDIMSLCEIAIVLYHAGDTAGWKEPLNKATEFDRKNVMPYLTAGDIFRMMAEKYPHESYNGLAAGRYAQALYYDPGNPKALTGQAELYIPGRNYAEAEKYLNEVITKDSNYIPALKRYGELEYTLGKYDKASLFYGRYMKLAEFSDKDLSKYITILYFNKEYAQANDLITPVLAKDPSNAVMLRLKGYTSYELGKYPDGLEAMKKFFDLRSEADTNKIIPTDYEYTGRLFSRTGNDSLAVNYLKKALDADNTKIALYDDISKSLEKQKKYLEAVDYYNKYIAVKNGNVASAIYFSIGRDLQLLANDVASTPDSLQRPIYLQRADTAFGKVVELSPNSHLGYLWRARANAGLDPETIQGLAKADYEKALSILEQKTDKEKYKNDLIEGYRYMGYYYYLQFEEAKKAKDDIATKQAKSDSLNYWQKVLELDTENDVAKQAINALK
jgi:Tfp pilus assembly protein PilF